MARTAPAVRGPGFLATRRSRICDSRSGTKYGRSCCLLSSPIWRATCPRWLRRLRISASRLLILERQSSRSIGAPDAHRSANPLQYMLPPLPAQAIQLRQLPRGQLPPAADGQRTEPQGPEADAPQAHDRMAERLAKALDLPIASLGERDLEPGGVTLGSQETDAPRNRRAIR